MAQAVPPLKTHEIFSLAVEKESDYYAIMNVGNVREFILGIEASRDMLEEMNSFYADEWLKSWCLKNFGKDSGEIFFMGKLLNPRDPKEALQMGIGIIHQELNMMEHLV